MKAVATENTNFVYQGPTPDIGDLPCQRVSIDGGPQDGIDVVFSIWKPSDEERSRIAAGENIRLGIYAMEPIPPVSLDIVDERVVSE